MTTRLRPYNPSARELIADWHVIDASGEVLGRLATRAAWLLMGKHRPGYVRHLLSGDFVVITNASQVRVTGAKAEQKVYVSHSGYPGHRKEVPFERMIERRPERVIEHAVRGMLPKTKLGARMLSRLKVVAGPDHPFAAQLIGAERLREKLASGADLSVLMPGPRRPRRKRRSVAEADRAATAPAQRKPVTPAPEAPIAEEPADDQASSAGAEASLTEAPPPQAIEADEAKRAPRPRTRRTGAAASEVAGKAEPVPQARRRSTSAKSAKASASESEEAEPTANDSPGGEAARGRRTGGSAGTTQRRGSSESSENENQDAAPDS